MIFGIVGFGRFGQFWAKALLPFGEVIVYDNAPIEETSVHVASLNDVARADIVFLLVPISQFEASCLAIKDHVPPSTLIVDCCSVKMYSTCVMQRVFSKTQPLFATHPLFGPDSVQKSGGLCGQKIVICHLDQVIVDIHKQLLQFLIKMGLVVLITTPEEHDKQMANSQALVHFIGRGLSALDLQEQKLSTPDFCALLNINYMVVNDAWQLFVDMHKYNPYTADVRKKLLREFMNIHHLMEEEAHHDID